MSEKYGYLKQFLPPHPQYEGTNRNWFFPVTEEEIRLAEQKLKIKFPDQLRTFYQEIGYGSLYAPHNAPEGYIASLANRIYPPKEVVDILLLGPKSGLILETAWKTITPGDLPFFEVGDSDCFLFMKPLSQNPNAVYDSCDVLIESEFKDFIWRLYYEDPKYYAKNW